MALQYSLIYDRGKKTFSLVLSDAIKSHEGQDIVSTFENDKKAIQALHDYSLGKKRFEDAQPRLTLKDVVKEIEDFNEVNSGAGLHTKGRWYSVPNKTTKKTYEDYLKAREKDEKKEKWYELPDAWRKKKT